MAKLVPDVAQQIQDDFEQSFAPQDSFFKPIDYQLKVIDARDAMLEEEFLIQWKYAQQKGIPYSSYIAISPDWKKRITIKLDHDKERDEWFADICEPLYEFPMDYCGLGVQEVQPLGQKCAEFVRIQTSEVWQTCLTASSPVILYSVEKCRIKLHNFDGACTDKLDVWIIPSQSSLPINEQVVPDGKADTIREMVISNIWRNYNARLGKIDMSNEGNSNPNPNESAMVYEGLKTK